MQVYVLTEEEAAEQALNLYSLLFDSRVRSGGAPEVLSIQRTSSGRTRSEEDSVGVYIVNFKNERGYIVLSESRFNEPIIAACDKGYLDITAP